MRGLRSRISRRIGGATAVLGSILSVCHIPVSLAHNDAQDSDWPGYGRTHDEQRFSPLTQINRKNIEKLGLAWSLTLPREARSLEATPLAVNGVLYFTASLSVVYAVDAVTGKELWRYDPQSWKETPQAFRTNMGVHRGVAYADGSIFFGSTDGRLISLDAQTGKVNWIVNTFEGDRKWPRQITGAPRIFNGKVIIGFAGADFATRGYVTAYDAKTGAQVWRFYTTPGNPADGFENEAMAMAAKSWNGEWWKWGGGGTVWNAITYDPDFNRIYLGVGNSANYDPRRRSPGGGDNLFLASIVALEADTGKYVWHYQVNPREAWDWKATADIVLAEIMVDGAHRKVLMQSPTNGFFYVIDRATGKLLSAEKIGKATWAERIDLASGRPVEAKNIRYEDGPITMWPSPLGVHNWQAMSYSPRTGLVYVPTMQLPATYWTSPEIAKEAEQYTIGSGKLAPFPMGAAYALASEDPNDGTGALVAWDPVAQKQRWSVKHVSFWNGGTMVTQSDLVFQGTADGWLRAYDANNGEELWKYFANQGIIAPPISYAVQGVQYITVLAGYGSGAASAGKIADLGWRHGKHPSRVLTFKLGGEASLPPTPAPDLTVRVINDPSLPIDLTAAERGAKFFNGNCLICHGPNGANGVTVAPDLVGSAAAHDLNTFRSILRNGLLAAGGMPQFDELSDEQIKDLHMAIRKFSRDAAAEAPSGRE